MGKKIFLSQFGLGGDTRRRQRYSKTAAVVIVWTELFKGIVLTFKEPRRGTAKKNKKKKRKMDLMNICRSA